MNQIYTTLFDQDKNENLLQWKIFTDYDEVVIVRGRVGMKQTESRTTSLGKNAGKKNETTGYTQAVKDAESKWRKQVKKGYTDDQALVGTTVQLAPLAKKYQEVFKNVCWDDGQIVLTKYDGVRCTQFFKKDGNLFQTRGGEAYPVIGEIAESLNERVFNRFPTAVVDGEIYSHGMHLEDITSATKKHNEDTDKLRFVVFDLFFPDKPEQTYAERLVTADMMLAGAPRIDIADHEYMYSEAAMINWHDELVRQGYEGVVIRDPEGLFKFNQRDISFIKYKVRHRGEYVTVKPIECKNGSVKIQCKVVFNGEVKFFEPAMVGTIEQQRRVLSDEGWTAYNTGHGTIEYEAISKYGIPAKAKFISFRKLDANGNPME